MNEPDFASYSEDQLRQILTHIDTLLLGLVGMCLGLVFGEQFEAMGAWGRMVGFLVMAAYFGSMDSRLCQGSSLGKRALDIRVITTAGPPLGVGRAVLRCAVFYMPYLLNNLALGDGYSSIVLPALQAVVVFGLGGATVYLYLFNRRTRQSVHDLLAGAIVVRARRAAVPPLPPLWKGHVAAVAALFVLVIGALFYIHSISDNRFFAPLRQVQQKVIALPGVHNATILENTSLTSADKWPKSLTINAVSSIRTVEEKNALARKIANIALTTYPAAQQLTTLSVLITHGYDIRIASGWTTTAFSAAPGAWQANMR